jgi:sulfate transport system permease protein
MASAAQTVRRKQVLRAPTATRLRHWGLRGAAIAYLVAMVVVPSPRSSRRFSRASTFRAAMASPGAWEAIRLTLVTSGLAAIINAIFGTMLAYVLVRYRFRGRAVLSAIVDLPFAIPTLVTGVMLVAIYGPNTPLGKALGSVGIQVIFAQLSILLALCVVTLPFVVRTVARAPRARYGRGGSSAGPWRERLEDLPRGGDAGDPSGDRRRCTPRVRARAR